MNYLKVLGWSLLVGGMLLMASVLAAQDGAETAVSTPNIAATPTIDRLGPPPTVENPSQADEGAYLYWLNCQPCHGDRGQGLTDEWRAQYPPEDQNCWARGCHGERPYEGGFTVPTAVPAVIGENSLSKFATFGDLYAYLRVAMPYNLPGTLSEQEYLAIVAFLAQAHNVWDGTTLDVKNIEQMRLQPHDLPTPPPTIVSTPTPASTSTSQPATSPIIWGITAAFLIIAGFWAVKRYRQ